MNSTVINTRFYRCKTIAGEKEGVKQKGREGRRISEKE